MTNLMKLLEGMCAKLQSKHISVLMSTIILLRKLLNSGLAYF